VLFVSEPLRVVLRGSFMRCGRLGDLVVRRLHSEVDHPVGAAMQKGDVSHIAFRALPAAVIRR